jgi:hypothetical protein
MSLSGRDPDADFGILPDPVLEEEVDYDYK